MAAKKILHVVTTALRKFKKELSARARQGEAKTRLVGDRKAGFMVGVERGSRIIVVSPAFKFTAQAEEWNARKHLNETTGKTIPLTARPAPVAS